MRGVVIVVALHASPMLSSKVDARIERSMYSVQCTVRSVEFVPTCITVTMVGVDIPLINTISPYHHSPLLALVPASGHAALVVVVVVVDIGGR